MTIVNIPRRRGLDPIRVKIDIEPNASADQCLRAAVIEAARSRIGMVGADLYGANLEGADLRVADLADAILADANLRGASLYGASLRGADLRWANLEGANLEGANLEGANLEGADLYKAALYEADLRRARLPPGLVLVGRATRRSDGAEALAWGSPFGSLIIVGGCRTLTLEDWRSRVASYEDAAKRAETTAILDYLEGRWEAWKEASS